MTVLTVKIFLKNDLSVIFFVGWFPVESVRTRSWRFQEARVPKPACAMHADRPEPGNQGMATGTKEIRLE